MNATARDQRARRSPVGQDWNGGGYDTVSVYAPGQWIDATTEETAQN